MSKTAELRQKRGELWDKAKAFLNEHADENGMMNAEDTAAYERMEQDIDSFGAAIDREERAERLERELNDEEDELISTLIAQAQAVAEDYCRVQFSESAPEPVRLAVMLMVSHYYENRDNPDRQVYVTMRIAFENLLYPYRDPAKMF